MFAIYPTLTKRGKGKGEGYVAVPFIFANDCLCGTKTSAAFVSQKQRFLDVTCFSEGSPQDEATGLEQHQCQDFDPVPGRPFCWLLYIAHAGLSLHKKGEIVQILGTPFVFTVFGSKLASEVTL